MVSGGATAADARGAGAFSTLLLVGALLVIAGFIVARKATRSAESKTPRHDGLGHKPPIPRHPTRSPYAGEASP